MLEAGTFLRLVLFLGLVFRLSQVLSLRKRNRVDQAKKPGTTLLKVVKSGIRGFLAFQALFLNLLPMPGDGAYSRFAGTVIFLVGLALTMIGRRQLGSNWLDMEDYQFLQHHSVVTNGVYHYIRHPIYAGDFLLFVGLQLALNSWLVLLGFLIIPLMVRQVLREEALLRHASTKYDTYCKRTKRFVPFIV